jgi:protein TIF31
MNPNETARAQVFMYNNIFFSRGVDAGAETFKVVRGDAGAKKSANRDVQCVSTLHRLDKSGLYTLATVLIDYLGIRYVCQSTLPGILHGEKSHTLLYGSVEVTRVLKHDPQLQEDLGEALGESLMIAARPILRKPLTQERVQEAPTGVAASLVTPDEDASDELGNEMVVSSLAMEAKAIQGSDKRRYVLDLIRLSPRDANWIAESKGGTGKWENAYKPASNSSIPAQVNDDEWTMHVLRPELVTRYMQHCMTKFMQEKKDAEAKNNGTESEPTVIEGDAHKDEIGAGGDTSPQKETDEKAEIERKEKTAQIAAEGLQYLKTIRLNINVFLPDVRSLEDIDEAAFTQIKEDEQRVRDASAFLWEDVLPKITAAVRDSTVYQAPVDGKSLTEFIHRFGVNCRYLGRLAHLAAEQEARDARMRADLVSGRSTKIERRCMPRFWLELLETEMVARAAKHLLDLYLTEDNAAAAAQPAQTVASFLSALVSESEETAAQTEARMTNVVYDEEDFSGLTMTGAGGGGDATPFQVRSRHEVWQDIELEVARRFRYSLTLYNTKDKSGNSSRALYVPLLRRVCQRTGVRLVARAYDVGNRCNCTSGTFSGGRLLASSPISSLDIIDIVPLMKHFAAYDEGFFPCTVEPTLTLPPLQVSMPDVRSTLEQAHVLVTHQRDLPRGLESAQEAGALYQRITESPCHPGILESLELMATIFLEAGDPKAAAAHTAKLVGLTTQAKGFDSSATYYAQLTLFQLLYASKQYNACVRHLRAAIFVLEILCGPRHTEHFNNYHKLGTIYSMEELNGKYATTALECFLEADRRESGDRLMDGVVARNLAKAHADLQNYSEALRLETSAIQMFHTFAGAEHELTQRSDADRKRYKLLADELNKQAKQTEKLEEESAKADALAAEIAAEEHRQNNVGSGKGVPKKKKKKG